MPLNFLEGLALIEKKCEFLRGERFQREEVVKAMGHIETQATCPLVRGKAVLYCTLRFGGATKAKFASGGRVDDPI